MITLLGIPVRLDTSVDPNVVRLEKDGQLVGEVSMKRVAIFYISEQKRNMGQRAYFMGTGKHGQFVGYIRAELTPPGTTLEKALDMATPKDYESVMNTYYVRAAK